MKTSMKLLSRWGFLGWIGLGLFGCATFGSGTAEDGTDEITACELLPQVNLTVSDIQLRVERVYYDHSTGSDVVVVMKRLLEVEDSLASVVDEGSDQVDFNELVTYLRTSREAVDSLFSTQLKVKNRQNKMMKEVGYLMSDILESPYPDGQERPYRLALAAQKILTADKAGSDKSEMNRLLLANLDALAAYCAPSYAPCANPQYKSGETFSKAASDYVAANTRLAERFKVYQEGLEEIREGIETYLELQCQQNL